MTSDADQPLEAESLTLEAITGSLRWLATRKVDPPLRLLQQAIADPEGELAPPLSPLTASTTTCADETAQVRALAVFGLLVDEIRRVGPSDNSRRRNVLIAAYRLPARPEVASPWRSSLHDRFSQLKVLRQVFGDPPPLTTTPMDKAWRVALAQLASAVQRRLAECSANGRNWPRYVEIGREIESRLRNLHEPDGQPSPSDDAQPVYANLFVTTVFLQGRAVRRRLTERLITSMDDGVNSYTAVAAQAERAAGVRIEPLWGCELRPDVGSSSDDPATIDLWFPQPLRRGDKHHFISEVLYESPAGEREWINVEIDHHGIAPGQRSFDSLPISGLTIRIRFQRGHVPTAAWWYREMTERARRSQPAANDPRRLKISGNGVEHTFEAACRHRGNYGIALAWPRS